MTTQDRTLLAGARSVAAVLLVAMCDLGAREVSAQAAAPSPRLAEGSFTAELNGFRIHYEVHGQGPVLMTLPNPWGLSLQGLRALYRPLEERLTLVYFDPRGMGASAPIREEADMGMAAVRADFDALRRHLGLQRLNAIGWSNGAMNLILLAAERPESLASAIFVHGAASFPEADGKAFAERYPDLMKRYEEFQKRVAAPALSADEKTRLLRTLWLVLCITEIATVMLDHAACTRNRWSFSADGIVRNWNSDAARVRGELTMCGGLG